MLSACKLQTLKTFGSYSSRLYSWDSLKLPDSLAKSTIVIVDGLNLMFASHFVCESIQKKKGSSYTESALNLLYSWMYNLKSTAKFHKIFFAVEGKSNFRKSKFPSYKQHRPQVGPTLLQQFNQMAETIRPLDLPVIGADGFEADDVIGSVSKQASEMNLMTIIISADHDMQQLLNDNVMQYSQFKHRFISSDDFFKKTNGLSVSRYPEFLALTGDVSDNIPGVASVGPVNAIKLLHMFSSLEELIANIDSEILIERKFNKKIIDGLKASRNDLLLYRELATIRLDVAIVRNQTTGQDVSIDDLLK